MYGKPEVVRMCMTLYSGIKEVVVGVRCYRVIFNNRREVRRRSACCPDLAGLASD